jgi:hypothetical protein
MVLAAKFRLQRSPKMDKQELDALVLVLGRSVNRAVVARLLKAMVGELKLLAPAGSLLEKFWKKVESMRPQFKTPTADNAALEKRVQIVKGWIAELTNLAPAEDKDGQFGLAQNFLCVAELVLVAKLLAKLEPELVVDGSDTSVELPKLAGEAPTGSNGAGEDIDFLEVVPQGDKPGKDKKKPSGSAAR